MKRNLTGYQFGIYWTIHVNKALASSNGNDCITLSTKNIDYNKWENQMINVIFYKNEIESLMHLFYRCHTIKYVLHELKYVFKIILENNIVLVEENLIIEVYEGEITEDLLLVNLVIGILKWKHEITYNIIKTFTGNQ